jgi:3-oxoacyl-[acyl-carrier-protein] synthase III
MLEQLNREIGLLATGSCLGERVVDNSTLRDMITGYDEAVSGPFGEWVEKVTHIRERRYLDTDKGTADLAHGAAMQALERAGLTGADIPCVIYCSFTYRETFPGDLLRFCESIGAPRTAAFNLGAACAGSVYGLGMAYALVKAGMYERVLVVGVENMSRIINFDDPLTVILFGDGAGAAIVGRKSPDTGGGFLDTMHFGQRIEHVNIHMGSSIPWYPETALIKDGTTYVPRAFVEMGGGPKVLRSAVNAMAEEAVQALGFEPGDLKGGNPELRALLDEVCVVPHQANGRIVNGIQKKLGLRDEQVYRTVYVYGNMSAATNLVTLDHGLHVGNFLREEQEDGPPLIKATDHRIQPGQLVVLTSIGGGYLYGAVAFVA